MDELVRMITPQGHIRAIAITARGLVERARQLHRAAPLATAALGRALMAASMMGCQLKEEQGAVTLTVKGGGPLGTIMAVSDHEGNVRGYVGNSAVELPLKAPGKLDVGAGVGQDGSLTVIKDIGLKEPYVGTVPLVSGEIAEDVTRYYAVSEQVPTACALGVLVDTDCSVRAAGGYLVQLLPGASDQEIDLLEKGVADLGPVTAALDGGMGGEEVLRQVLAGFQPEVLARTAVAYRCTCARTRMERALVSLGAKDLQALIDEQDGAELTCRFCRKSYRFTREELQGLLPK